MVCTSTEKNFSSHHLSWFEKKGDHFLLLSVFPYKFFELDALSIVKQAFNHIKNSLIFLFVA